MMLVLLQQDQRHEMTSDSGGVVLNVSILYLNGGSRKCAGLDELAFFITFFAELCSQIALFTILGAIIRQLQ